MMKKGILILLVLALAAVAFFVFRPEDSGTNELRDNKNFNVILITVDTLRADRLGCYGFLPDVTPAMNKMAAAGVRFENCIAQTPLTLPSHTTILTGTLP
ncbi:MAG: sulfatase-like hydrolase/transferase, partial [Candidatus Saccharicenans sp.]|nr:sulfatase-like hydrolase/transferase [Candidatus Saccharicenans sp.]